MPEPKAQTELTHFRLINLLKLQMEQVAPALRLLLVLLHKLGVIQDQVVPGSKQVGSLLPVQLEPLERTALQVLLVKLAVMQKTVKLESTAHKVMQAKLAAMAVPELTAVMAAML